MHIFTGGKVKIISTSPYTTTTDNGKKEEKG